MTSQLKTYGLDRLSMRERLSLMHDLWDSLSRELEQTPFTEEEHQIIDRRIASHEADPGSAVPWEVVKAQALARIRK